MNSAAVAATITAAAIRRIFEPGCAHHSDRDAPAHVTTNAAIHGLRRPAASAMAPKIGVKTAISTPAPACV